MYNDDVVIRQINEFLLELNFIQTCINGRDVFKYTDGYYLLSGGPKSYFLEFAETLHEVENNCFEDLESYSATLYSEQEIVTIIKKDLIQYISGN